MKKLHNIVFVNKSLQQKKKIQKKLLASLETLQKPSEMV